MSYASMFSWRTSKRDNRQAHFNSLQKNPLAPSNQGPRGETGLPRNPALEVERAPEAKNRGVEEGAPEILLLLPSTRPPKAEKRPAADEVDPRPSRRLQGLALEDEGPDPDVEVITQDLSIVASPSVASPLVFINNFCRGGWSRQSCFPQQISRGVVFLAALDLQDAH